MSKLTVGTFLPGPLDREVMRRLSLMDRYPGLCQSHRDAMGRIHKVALSGAVEVERAQCVVDRVEAIDNVGDTIRRPENFYIPRLGMWGVALGCIGAGVAFGYLLGK